MIVTYTVPAEAAKQRLDVWLAAQMEGVSRERVQALLEQEKVRLDGKSPRASYRLRGGEEVEIHGDPTPRPLRAYAEEIPLTVVYEDEDLSVIDKPAGMTVHAGAGVESEAGTLVNALLHRYQTLSQVGGEMRPGIVHRLDKQTSGLMVVARNDATHAKLAAMFAQREVRKTYIALVHGHLKQDRGTIDAPIARDLLRRTRMTTKRHMGTRTAVSHYTVLRRINSRFGSFTLVSVRIETGTDAPDPRASGVDWAPSGGRYAVWSAGAAGGCPIAAKDRSGAGKSGTGAEFSACGGAGVRASTNGEAGASGVAAAGGAGDLSWEDRGGAGLGRV